jgi:hypothetical protein
MRACEIADMVSAIGDRRECRGIIFHAETGALLARRYHKFFNVNELDETLPGKTRYAAYGHAANRTIQLITAR